MTPEKIAQAIDRMRTHGHSGQSLMDPNLIAQFLPREHIAPAYVTGIDLPASIAVGQPAGFTVRANFPDPSYSFDSWEIAQSNSMVVVRMVGGRTGEAVGAVVVPVELTGELPGLSPGDYVIRFQALGNPVDRTLHVE